MRWRAGIAIATTLGAAGVRSITLIDSDGNPSVKLDPFSVNAGVELVNEAAPVVLFFCALSSADPYRHI